ncbi:hypothetical protein Dip510_001460 [Elusimicrobium posterum]|uniref:DUF4402 domain-containing protein n=1 Tax=Elusimicrobium posterum TaxID=3116653 RepID=UPI003C779983
MKKVIISVMAVFLLYGVCAAATVTGTGTATAVILTPVTVANTTTLNFASIIPGTTAGTVVVAQATGTATYTGGAQFGGGTTAAGVVTLTGPNNQAITSVAIADGSIAGTPSGSMTVTGFITSCPSGTGCTLNASGTLAVNFGATLNVAANQSAGTYTGNVTVTVTY